MFGFSKKKNNSAKIAKERLQLIVTRDKSHNSFDFMPKLEKELIDVISKYVEISAEDVSCTIDDENGTERLELNVNFAK